MTCELTPDERSKSEFTGLVSDWLVKLRKSQGKGQCHCAGKREKSEGNIYKTIKEKRPGLVTYNNKGEDHNVKSLICEKHYNQAEDNFVISEWVKGDNAMSQKGQCRCENLNNKVQDSGLTKGCGTKSHDDCYRVNTVHPCDKKELYYCDHSSPIKCCRSVDDRERKNETLCESVEPVKACMIGLHCCGDLTPTMLHRFVDCPWITSLVCVSCCYHRMAYDGK